MAKRVGRMVSGTFNGNINALEQVLKSGAKTWVPGHGPSGDSTVVTNFLGYLVAVYGAAKHAFEEDMDSGDVPAIAVERTKAYEDWVGYADEVGKHATQAYLEIEAAEF